MAKGGQKDHSGMDKETYDQHYAANKYIGGHHGIEGSPNKMIGGIAGAMAPQIDPATGAPVQPGQLLQNDISSTALGGAQATTIPAMFPQTPQPRVLNNTMSQNI